MNIANIMYLSLWLLEMREQMPEVLRLSKQWANEPKHLIDLIMVDSEWP